ncbi:MAG: gamma-glutamylcyclotransferase family protein [Sphingobacteriia bacterium]|jgi:gamma-glutamylcyclotransferase (GGCT)/AIG2-like uncharacterized protein YtfP
MPELVFSYGTLQLEKVQLETFGRILNGSPDVLKGYELKMIEITDLSVLAKSEQRFHPMAIPSEDSNQQIEGVVFEITEEELLQSDSYEVDAYKRVNVMLDSGKNAWIYIKA